MSWLDTSEGIERLSALKGTSGGPAYQRMFGDGVKDALIVRVNGARVVCQPIRVLKCTHALSEYSSTIRSPVRRGPAMGRSMCSL